MKQQKSERQISNVKTDRKPDSSVSNVCNFPPYFESWTLQRKVRFLESRLARLDTHVAELKAALDRMDGRPQP